MVLLIAVGLLAALAPAPAAAEGPLDSVLGMPWGSSAEQSRQIMARNNFAFFKEAADPETGTPIISFKGIYAGYRAYVYLSFMYDQLWRVDVSLWEDDIGGLDYPFNDLNGLLTGKYGPVSRNDSYNMPAQGLPKPVPITRYVWIINGDAKKITLNKRPTFQSGKDKLLGAVSVFYENWELYNALRNKSRQNI